MSTLARPRLRLLAGDVGATGTRLGLFETGEARPRTLHVSEFSTTKFPALTDVIRAFLAAESRSGESLAAACFGVAGPVLGDTARLTNVPFSIDAPAIGREFQVNTVALLNDLQAMAYSLSVLSGDELHVLQRGTRVDGGNVALVAAGTGLGEALLQNVGGRLIPSPTEAGHADWAARTDRDIAILRQLIADYGRAEVEHVVSGIGLRNLHRAMHPAGCSAGIDGSSADTPAMLTRAALERRCQRCVEALEVFVDAYGAETGNLALRSLATGGVFVGGGIAPKILPALTDGRFLHAFLDKGPMRDLVGRMPLSVILNADAGLLGAAVYAASLVN
jgi:glucokinase